MRWQIPKTGPAANSARLPCQEREEDNKTPSTWRAASEPLLYPAGREPPVWPTWSGPQWLEPRLAEGRSPSQEAPDVSLPLPPAPCQTEGGSFLLNGDQVVLRQLEPPPPAAGGGHWRVGGPSSLALFVCFGLGSPVQHRALVCVLFLLPPGWERPDICRRPRL